ncbi:MAG: DUF4143 domain-containing protein [Nitrospirae bacterium]|nr:DUF4143 domain-containing protein [Candidatus Troglogloeales bacterium]
MINRRILSDIETALDQFPAVALLGPRQAGKTTLAHFITSRHTHSLYLDLERPSDLAKLVDQELFLSRHRISFNELAPFDMSEVQPRQDAVAHFWLRGGYPLSWLAKSDAASLAWRESFIITHLERDIPAFGIRVAGPTLRRFWQMLAHLHGQTWNASRLASGFGVSAPTVQHYLEILEATYMVRRLPPLQTNLGKRLVKSTKVYLRDSGLLHALLQIPNLDGLFGHPVVGPSWEGWVLEQIALLLSPQWTLSFYRTATGAEIDIVAERGRRRIGFEIKFSSAPALSKGFWSAMDDLQIEQAYVVAPVKVGYPMAKKVDVLPAVDLAKRCRLL